MTAFKLTMAQTRMVVVAFLALGALVMYHEYGYSTGRLHENAPLTGETMEANGQTDGPEDDLQEQPDNRSQAVMNESSVSTSNGEVGNRDTGRDGADEREESDEAAINEQVGEATNGKGDAEEQDKNEGAGPTSPDGSGPRTDSSTLDVDRAGDEQSDEQSDGEGAGAGKLGDSEKGTEKPGSGRGARGEESGKECVRFVVYDKPVKTGSTTITQALKRVLGERDGRTAVCKRAECLGIAQGICAGKKERINLVQHMEGKDGVLECLRDSRGYYVATSIRDPFTRWESAFWYNKQQKRTHYGISWEAGYEEFMRRMPACAMLAYFDGLDKRCGGEVSVEERVRRIVKRYDEIIDLFDEPKGMLEGLVQPFLGKKNESPKTEGVLGGAFDRRRLENETFLYEAMKKRRAELLQRPKRRLCG